MESPAWEFAVEQGKVREFGAAVHDEFAGASPPSPPPTFPICATAEYVTRLIVEQLKLDRRYVVHGEHEYEYFRPLRVGDRLTCRARITQDFVKSRPLGGHLRFIITETEMHDAATGELAVRERATSIQILPVGAAAA
jgi:N-terminal half of MaoC dehydratase